MIINIKHKSDLITLDFKLNQIRYLRNPEQHGQIRFIEMSQTDADAYLFLFDYNRKIFFKSLREDLFNFERIRTTLKYMEVLR
jgi:hypothetical protein